MNADNPRVAKRSRGTSLMLGFALAGLVMLASGFLTYRAAREFAESSRLVQQTYSILDALQTIETRYAEAVSEGRGYAITGDERYLRKHEAAAAGIDAAVLRAIERMSGNPQQQQDLRGLIPQMARREEVMKLGLNAFAAGGIPAVKALGRDTDILEADKAVVSMMTRIKTEHTEILRRRSALDAQRLNQLRSTLTIFFLCSAAILVLFCLRARRGIRERERDEHEVERQRRFADSIIENAPVGVYIKETRGLTIVRVNRFVEEITGRPRQEVLGKDDHQLMPPEVAAKLIEAERELVRHRQMLSFEEVQLDTPHGRRMLHVRKVLITDDKGEITHLLGISEDVTERRHAEQQQQKFAETLERKGRELESANKELESFSYSVSHDLRAPLRAVEGYAAILEEDYAGSLDEEGRRFLHNIREGATRMGQLIQDLLAFSRLGRQPLALSENDTRLLVQGVWEALRTAQPDLRAELVTGPLPPSYGDPRLLQQVWTNLLENAAKYSSKSEFPRIEVSGETDGTEAVFSVQDNGVGFDMRYYDKLFNVFQRLHSESEYSGTGVGLAIVHRVVARHGGRVWARSEPGKGACFSFALPCKHAALGDAPEPAA